MRYTIQRQLSLVEPSISHPHAKELQGIQMIFDLAPEIIQFAKQDLMRNQKPLKGGRPAIFTAEQVLKALMIKQMNEFSYDELQFHLNDSRCYREFCGIGIADTIPKRSTLQRDLSAISADTLEKINHCILKVAKGKNLENGRSMRFDATNVASNIHAPSDSSLLWDSVRVLCRLTQAAKKDYAITVCNHTRAAKKYSLGIQNAKNAKQRKKIYRTLVRLTKKVISESEMAVTELGKHEGDPRAKGFTMAIAEVLSLANGVVRQTEARVFHGTPLPSQEKVVSIFEPHTDILKKSRRDTEYGHKITLGCGKSGLITDLVVEDGNPADSTLAQRMVERHEEIYKRLPREVAFDGGYASKANLKVIKDKGVKHVCFHKKRGISIAEMTKSLWTFKRLRNFRAGIEGMISYLKRCFGLDRCTWKGLEHFKSYVWASVVSANAVLLGRMLIC